MPATDLAHPEEDRPLSIEEYKRLQEFPDFWKFAGPLIQQYKQVGNAVPHSLGKSLGQTLIKCLKGEKIIERIKFPYSRYKNTSEIEWQKQFERESSKLLNSQKQLSFF